MSTRPNYQLESPCRIPLSPCKLTIQHGTARVTEGNLQARIHIGASRLTDDGAFNDVQIAFRAANKRPYCYRTTVHAMSLLPFGTIVELVDDQALTEARATLRDDGFSFSCTLDDRTKHTIQTICGETVEFLGKYVSCMVIIRPTSEGSFFRATASMLFDHKLVTSPYGLLMRYDYPLSRLLWHRASHRVGREALIQDLDYVDIAEDPSLDLGSLPPSPIEIIPV